MKNNDLQITLEYSGESSLMEDYEPDQFRLRMRARVVGNYYAHTEDEEDFSLPLGSVKFALIRTGNALEADFPLREVFDLTQELTDLAAELLDSSLEDFNPEVTQTFPYANYSGDLLVIESLDLEPFACGQRLGLSVIYRIIQDWEPGCSFTLMRPHPEELGATGDEIPGEAGGDFAIGEAAPEDSHQDLARYFGDLGFKKIPGSRFLALSSSMARPPIFELALPDRLEISGETLQTVRPEHQV